MGVDCRMKALLNLVSWKSYLRYVLLTGAIFFIHYLSDISGVEKYAIETVWIGWVALFMFYMLGILVFDTIIRMILGED